MTDRKVLTLQDISCLGQCSLTVALPIISACGVETIILPSAVLSTHTGGFSGFTFRDLTEDLPGIMKHWQKEGLLFDCLYTGYLGSVTQIEYVYDLREKLLKDNSPLIVDPAMADHGRLYTGFDQNFVKHMGELCGKADIILPNLTEAALITNTEYIAGFQEESYILKLLEKLGALGAKIVILKGINYKPGIKSATPHDQLGIAIYDCTTKDLQYYFHEKQPHNSHGTGDCFASAFTGALMQGKTMFEAARLAADFVVACLKATKGDENHRYGVKFERALPMLVQELNR